MNFYSILTAAACLILVGGDALAIGPMGKAYGNFAILANIAVDDGKIARDAGLDQIDAFIGSHYPDEYAKGCKTALGNPDVFTIKDSQQVETMSVIGFTAEVELESKIVPPPMGRFVFYWDKKYLRVSPFTKENFENLVSHHNLKVDETNRFKFPELVKAAAAPPLPPSSSGAPPLPESVKEFLDTSAATERAAHPKPVQTPDTPVSGKSDWAWWMIALAFLVPTVLAIAVIKRKFIFKNKK